MTPLESLTAPMAATVLQLTVAPGDTVQAGQLLVVLEAMKMEHELHAEHDGSVQSVAIRAGDAVAEDQVLLTLRASATPAAPQATPMPVASAPAHAPCQAPVAPASAPPPAPRATNAAPLTAPVAAQASSLRAAPAASLAGERADLQALRARAALTQDANRPAAVAKRHALGLRMARENIAALCDADSFVEYGAFAIAAQRRRRSLDDLMQNTPADGMVCGIGSVNGSQFGPEAARCVVMSYDATVLAGTQGMRNHQKTDRMVEVALAQKLPVLLFAEGGGGRPGDTDSATLAGLHLGTFASYARLSGQVPVVGIAAGRCFAGNAALLGCSDVIIATRGSNIGMGGPAMIEGGGLGVYAPEQIGPAEVQSRNGVIDVLVDDEAAAVRAAQHYLSFFQGRLSTWQEPDTLRLRDAVPENRVRSYEVRNVLRGVADAGSLLELRAGFGVGIVTALARIEGRPVGFLANNPMHLGGAIDADAADKAARFVQLCNGHGLPLVSFIDTPGFMVGPDIEALAQVRHVSRLFVHAAHLRVPLLSVVLRKGYGLGAMAMAGGSFHAPAMMAAWPSGEFGGMGLEGAVRLGYRKELEAVPEGPEREALYQRLVAEMYERGKAINMASALEIDTVIDPADTRRWLALGLDSTRVRPAGSRPIDTW